MEPELPNAQNIETYIIIESTAPIITKIYTMTKTTKHGRIYHWAMPPPTPFEPSTENVAN